MKLQLAMAGIGFALIAVSVHANGGDLPAVVDAKAAVVRSDAVPSAAAVRSYDQLSPGNRLIAQALYNAQKAGSATGRQPWSLERVAVARAGGQNWGDVFRQMKQEGLLEAETLGQVVTWYQYHQVTPVQAKRDSAASFAGVTPIQAKPGQ